MLLALSNLNFENTLKPFWIQNYILRNIQTLRKLQKTLPKPLSITIYKSFIRPKLDYGDIIHDQAYIVSFHQKL